MLSPCYRLRFLTLAIVTITMSSIMVSFILIDSPNEKSHQKASNNKITISACLCSTSPDKRPRGPFLPRDRAESAPVRLHSTAFFVWYHGWRVRNRLTTTSTPTSLAALILCSGIFLSLDHQKSYSPCPDRYQRSLFWLRIARFMHPCPRSPTISVTSLARL